MKLVVVGHSYATAFAQRKYVEMKRQCPDLELRILTPRTVPHVFMRYARETAPGLLAGEVVDIREFFGRSHMSYVLDPFRFARLLREFRPDRIHIEEDPHSAAGVETVFLARMFCPAAKISFFIWDNLAREPRFPLGIVKRMLSRYALGRAELVVCGNREAERLLRDKKGYEGRAAVLPQLGIDPGPYRATHSPAIRDELRLPDNIPLIGFVGRLIPEKGVSLLLAALQQLMHVEWRLLIVGSGPLEEEIARTWQAKFGERLVHRKAVPYAAIPDCMRAMDMLVLPSYATARWKEQFGLVLAQAMMAEVPCIGSDSGAIPDVIGPGGLVFGEKDVDALASALERMLTDEGLRQALGAAGRDFASRRYTHEAVAAAYLEQWGETACCDRPFLPAYSGAVDG